MNTVYIAPAGLGIGGRCNVYHIPYDASGMRMDAGSQAYKDMKHIGILQGDYRTRTWSVVCMDYSLTGDLTPDNFKYAHCGTYFIV
jgi:hypothetical protein